MPLKYVSDSPLCVLRGHRSNFLSHAVFMSIKIVFTLANSADPDEMPPNVTFHLRSSLFAKVPVMKRTKTTTTFI